jgi:uncharacterized protein (DUF2236 family)
MAHPLVAAGVVAHSDYRRDLWKRLVRTLRALYLMAYGTKAEAERAGAAVRAVHAEVGGTTTERLGPFAAGTPYAADDPALMLWVHATLAEASLAVYTRYVARLTVDEEERYYREMSHVARLFGTPAEVVPVSLAAFREYFQAQLASGDIVVTQPARDIAAVILAARLPRADAGLRARAPAGVRRPAAGPAPRRVRAALEHGPCSRVGGRRPGHEADGGAGAHGRLALRPRRGCPRPRLTLGCALSDALPSSRCS